MDVRAALLLAIECFGGNRVRDFIEPKDSVGDRSRIINDIPSVPTILVVVPHDIGDAVTVKVAEVEVGSLVVTIINVTSFNWIHG